ncbi:type IV pilus twitching motility protein PilT [Christensenellaceae bacterium OttesenSCG-928-K19]|nr:type IV pilus twitching motility protein PilT [Christensenellaceae bacterium OttesenSCG-928-K19]
MINGLLEQVRLSGCSDLHIACGQPPVVRRNGFLDRLQQEPYTDAQVRQIAQDMLDKSNIHTDFTKQDIDFGYETPDGARHRVNIFRQSGTVGIAIRLLQSGVPTIDQLALPNSLREIATLPRGLVLVTGPTGSGKSTTLAAMIDEINEKRNAHILTLEDPIEYVHQSKCSLVNQREVGKDVDSFASALRSALREDPDVILVGEMRDLETISAAITAAETGHLVLSTLHTTGAAKTIDRIIDVFPPHQQQQVRTQLATVLQAVITQTLLPRADATGRVPAFEIMMVNDAIANMIREGKTFQIGSVLQTSGKAGMISLDMYLARLVKDSIISMDEALGRAVSREELRRYATI